MPLKNYSTTPASNNSAPPNGWPEGMAPSAVNDCARQMMADIRSFYNTLEFRDWGHTPVYVSSTSFTVTTDVTGVYTANRRVRLTGSGAMGTIYGKVTSSSYLSPNTTVTVTLDSGSIDNSLNASALGFDPTNTPIITSPPDGDKGDITVSSNGTAWAIDANAITTSKIADTNVTTAKLSDDAVTAAKVSEETYLQHGQCRLVKSSSNLLLHRFNGQWININNTIQSIPSAGVTLAATGLTPGTLYYIYAYMNDGTMTLEASTTGHSTHTNGVEIKTGDATRTLVGMARPITGPAWQDTAQQRFVVSYFNRKDIIGYYAVTSSASFSTTSFTEISSSYRIEFLTWSDELCELKASGPISHGSSNVTYAVGIGVDGATPKLGYPTNANDANGRRTNGAYSPYPELLSEGYHYSTLTGFVQSGNGTIAPDAPTHQYIHSAKIIG